MVADRPSTLPVVAAHKKMPPCRVCKERDAGSTTLQVLAADADRSPATLTDRRTYARRQPATAAAQPVPHGHVFTARDSCDTIFFFFFLGAAVFFFFLLLAQSGLSRGYTALGSPALSPSPPHHHEGRGGGRGRGGVPRMGSFSRNFPGKKKGGQGL
jgi:hypothetical protein